MRPEGWELLLYHHILDAKAIPFSWGRQDCVLWCADWLLKIAGMDPAADYRGKYATSAEACTVLASLGCDNLPQLCDKHLPRLPVSKAQRGDILFHSEGMLGICDGVRTYFLTANGITHRPTLTCIHAWKVT